MKIITISGVDGSGKSTQIQLLIEFLKHSGGNPYHFHAIKFSVASFGKNKITTPGELKSVTKASWMNIQLRKIAFLIDLFRFELFANKLSKQGYTHIVADRYYYDALINILYLSGDKRTHNFGVEFLMKLIHIPDVALFLHVSPDIITSRSRTIDQDRSYMEAKVKLYLSRVNSWNITKMDGQRDPEVIAADIQNELHNSL